MKNVWTREHWDHPTRGEAQLAYRLSGATLDHIVMYVTNEFSDEAAFPTVERARDYWRTCRQALEAAGFVRRPVGQGQPRLPLVAQTSGRGPYRRGLA
jgi:hypothetical protein